MPISPRVNVPDQPIFENESLSYLSLPIKKSSWWDVAVSVPPVFLSSQNVALGNFAFGMVMPSLPEIPAGGPLECQPRHGQKLRSWLILWLHTIPKPGLALPFPSSLENLMRTKPLR